MSDQRERSGEIYVRRNGDLAFVSDVAGEPLTEEEKEVAGVSRRADCFYSNGTPISPLDIGVILEAPEDQRLDVDPDPAYNADAGFDIQVVPDGEYVELSTAGDEPLASEEPFEDDDGGDGAPLEFLSPNDPVAQED